MLHEIRIASAPITATFINLHEIARLILINPPYSPNPIAVTPIDSSRSLLPHQQTPIHVHLRERRAEEHRHIVPLLRLAPPPLRAEIPASTEHASAGASGQFRVDFLQFLILEMVFTLCGLWMFLGRI
nr:hypothetical protein Iba_chr06aCG1770 [Ipomoea batatas]